jgi:putative cardiolipin synthase
MTATLAVLRGGSAQMKPLLSYPLVLLLALLASCATLPPPKDRIETAALTDTAGTRLGRAIAPGVAVNPGKTGIHAIPDPRDAFAARMLLSDAAEKSLDVQYFIWHGDHVGHLLFQALFQARRASEHRGAPLQPGRHSR